MGNYYMIQLFEWNLPPNGTFWRFVEEQAPILKEKGFEGVWLPPCYKGISINDVGYGVYDLYDLGEFDQKGGIRTKYGTKGELLSAIEALQSQGMKVYMDVVLNHKAGADRTETFNVVRVRDDNREEVISEPFEIEGWTAFDFAGRNNKYSSFKWSFNHFTATDFDNRTGNKGIFKILGENKDFSHNVDEEYGNYDYLMYANIDYSREDVINETIAWGKWFIDTLKPDGLRLDAIKHINDVFIERFIKEIYGYSPKELYVVGEYWKTNTETLKRYLAEVDNYFDLFDVVLHYNFYEASKSGRDYDLTKIFDGTLVSQRPQSCVTFVDNHDSQPGSSLESWVSDEFKIEAYALILPRRDGYPCIFYGDYYSIGGDNPIDGKGEEIDRLLEVRRKYAYGEQIDTFDFKNVIAWQRMGDDEHKGSGVAVVISNGDEGFKSLDFGQGLANTRWYDFMGNRDEIVELDENGVGTFTVNASSISVWVREMA